MNKILKKALNGKRISPEEAVRLFETTDMLLLGNIASRISRKKLRERVVTYIVDRNINYTNICITDCAFCAFYRKEDDEEAYVHPFETIAGKIEETIALGGRQILLQGGHNINLKIDYFEDLFQQLNNINNKNIQKLVKKYNSNTRLYIKNTVPITGRSINFYNSKEKQRILFNHC